MALKHTSQQKSALGDEIVDLLTELSSRYGLTWRKISEEIKVGEGTLSRVYNLKKKGGRQLFGALILLKKVIELENTVAGRARACGSFFDCKTVALEELSVCNTAWHF